MGSRRVHILAALLCTGLWAGAIWLGHSGGHLRFLDRLESALSDVRTLARGIKAPPDLVTIVAIDDTIVKLSGAYPLPRAEIAKIVEAIGQLAPKVIAIDLLLVDKGPADGDAALANALAASPSVLAAAAVFSNTHQSSAADDAPLARLPEADHFLLPLPLLADHAEVGIVNVTTGRTGTPLSVPMLFRTRDKIELSFPLRVASVAIGEKLTIAPDRLSFGDRSIATAADYALPLSYYGPRRTIRTVSAANLLSGQVDKEAIRGRIVVLGATATGAGDFFPTPFDSLMPGAEIIATAITHLVAGGGVVHNQAVRVVEAIATILLPVVLVGLLAWRRNAIGLLTVSAALLAWAAANTFAFAHGIWLDAATTMAATLPPVVLFGTLQLWSGRHSAQHLAVQNRLLEQFQTPGLQEWLTRDPEFLLAPVRQNAAVVFIDLSGFTALSETLDPNATQSLLKGFHALVEKEVTKCDGMITSFLGDGVMILFGLPEASADDAARAAQCSIALCVKTERWIKALPSPIGSRIGFKIGAHFGPIVASRLGGRNHQHITATGDTVNVASRLMEVAASHDVRLVLSDTLRDATEHIGARLRTGSLAGPVEAQIRGRTGSLTVWLWRDDLSPADQRMRPDAAE
jgi:adenylate cyclase